MSANSTKIYLVRHGETLWNSQQRWQGSKNSPLTALGIQQATLTRDLLATNPIDLAYASPLQRATQTLEIILQDRDIDTIIFPAMREMCLGSWEGRTRSEIAISEPVQTRNFRQRPDLFNVTGAETFAQLQLRVIAGLDSLFLQHSGKNILIVSHWVAIKVALAYYKKIALRDLSQLEDPKNAQVIILSKEHSGITIRGSSDFTAAPSLSS